MANVNFSLGSDFGQVLTDIAREKIIVNHDGPAALKVITDSLIGCPEELALDVIFLDKQITVDSDGGVNIEGDDNNPCDGSNSGFEEIFENQLHDLITECQEWRDCLIELKRDIKCHYYNGILKCSIPADAIFNKLFNIDNSTIDLLIDYNTDELSSDIIRRIYDASNGIKDLFNRLESVLNATKWIYSKRPQSIPDGFTNVPEIFCHLKCDIQSLSTEDVYEIKIPSVYQNMMEDLSDRNKDNSHNICEPADITKKYDAGWLSPDGTFYGANGDFSSMIHMTLAKALLEYDIISIPQEDIENSYIDYMRNPDAWMEAKGWVKIHHDHVLFGGYYHEPECHLTDKQISEIVRYGCECYNNYLTFGPSRKRTSMIRFRSIEPLMLYKLFDYDVNELD